MDLIDWTVYQLGAQKPPFFLALSSIYTWVEKKQPMILPKKWCEHRNQEDFLVETTPLVETSPWCFDQFLSSTTSQEVPTVGFLLQSQAMVKNTECPGEGAKHFLFFCHLFGDSHSQACWCGKPEEITTLGALTDIYFNHVILLLMGQKIFANQLRLVVYSTIIPLTNSYCFVSYCNVFFIFSTIYYNIFKYILLSDIISFDLYHFQYFSCNCNIFKIILHCLLFCNVISNYIDILD